MASVLGALGTITGEAIMMGFIGCLPRAGSTLLTNVLMENENIHATPSSGVSDSLMGANSGYANSPFSQAYPDREGSVARHYQACRGYLESFYAEDLNACSWVFDKSRQWIHNFELLKKMYPEGVKLIAPIRDLRGCVSSMEKLFRNHPEHFPNQPKTWLTIEGRVQAWLSEQPLGTAAMSLKDSLVRGSATQIHFVRMEDFTANPEAELRKIYEYLDTPYFEHDVSNVKQRTHEHDGLHEPFGSHKIKEGAITPIQEDFDTILGRKLANSILTENQWFYNRFYPELI